MTRTFGSNIEVVGVTWRQTTVVSVYWYLGCSTSWTRGMNRKTLSQPRHQNWRIVYSSLLRCVNLFSHPDWPDSKTQTTLGTESTFMWCTVSTTWSPPTLFHPRQWSLLTSVSSLGGSPSLYVPFVQVDLLTFFSLVFTCGWYSDRNTIRY